VQQEAGVFNKQMAVKPADPISDSKAFKNSGLPEYFML